MGQVGSTWPAAGTTWRICFQGWMEETWWTRITTSSSRGLGSSGMEMVRLGESDCLILPFGVTSNVGGVLLMFPIFLVELLYLLIVVTMFAMRRSLGELSSFKVVPKTKTGACWSWEIFKLC